MIKNTIAYSETRDKYKAFEEVSGKIDKEGSPLLIIFFSPFEGFDFFSHKLHKQYENSIVIGSSSTTSYSPFGYSDQAFTALAFYEGIECFADVLLEVTHYPMKYASKIEDALGSFDNLKNTVCIEFTTSFGRCEELVQDTFRSVLESKKIPIVGGTAGSDALTSPTAVSLNGTVYSEACVFVLIKNLNGKIFTYKENLFKPTNRYVTSTDVDCDERIVYEFDGRPAAEVVSELTNVPIKELKESISFYPLGRLTGEDIYITCPDRIMPDGSITCFARIYNRTKMTLLEKDNFEEVWAQTAEIIKKEIPNPSVVFGVNCAKRAALFKSENRNGDFDNELLDNYGNFLCMSGFGEQIKYEHFNLTLVLCVFE